MMDDHPGSHRSKEREGSPGGRADAPGQPGRPAGPGEAGFADRLRHHGSLNSSIIRYPGPHDYCGFEAPALGPVEPRSAGGLWDPSGHAARGDWMTIDLDLGGQSLVADGPAGGGPGPWRFEPRPDGSDSDFPAAGEAAAPRRPGPAPRLRRPTVPGYEILEELGRGGMGVVYKARQLRLNRLVALKMILAGEYAGTDAVERFLAEARMVARVRHPNVVQIHAIGDFEGRPYVELEYVEGGSLGSRLDGTPWPPRAAARLVESLASALAEAHREGIVHRDLKPANILITDDGTPKITDFGLAKSSERDLGLTRTDSILGSPCYMAPEQAEGHARDVGPTADIYALGANLYELLTGRPPFVGPSVLATLELVKDAEPVPPSQLQPGVAPDLETICLKCLRKEPARRYESARALAEDLGRFLAGEPILARPTTQWERAWKWVHRRPSTAALVVVSALSILAAAGSGLWYRAERDRRRAEVRRRIQGVRAQVNRSILLGEEALRRKDWDGARAQMIGALALIRAEPELAATGADAARALAYCEAKITDRRARADARARRSAFQAAYDEAVFYQSQYTGLEPEANQRASRAAARRALEQFEPATGPGTGLELVPGALDATEAGAITGRYYELALILAAAVSQPIAGEDPAAQAREALRVLDRVERVRTPTRAYFLRRAEYLLATGDRPGAETARARAESAGVAEDSAVDDFLEGEGAYRRHDYPRALAALRRLLTRQPGHFWGQYLLAICHLKEHRPAEAQVALTVCQATRSGFVWTYLLKGFAEGEMGEFDLAESDFQRAAELGLDEAARYVMLVNRGVMRVRRGRSESAAEDFRAAIALKSDQFQAYINLAQAYQNLGRLDRALGALDRAIDRFPDRAVLYRARARVHRLRSDDPRALADLARAVALSPADGPARAGDYMERAILFQQAGRHAEALAECDRALAIQPDRADVHRVRGAALVKLKRLDEAIRSFDVCLARGAPSAALYEARGLARAHTGSYERAITDYTLALGLGRATAALHGHRGWAYLFSGAPGSAARDFDEALRLVPGDARALSGRALAKVQRREVREAIADARASMQAAGPDARLAYNAARVFCQAAACLEADPARPQGAWEAAGRHRTEALALIERSLSLTPAPERAAFWTQVIRSDDALGPIRSSRRFLELDAQVARRIGTGALAGVPPR
jgi:tetratricopeptide (TPR) repeat protein/tRNA A-37 threonylcarbamoyl transferase component Bud32